MDRITAINTVFCPIMRNILKAPKEAKFRTLREGNAMISKAFGAMPLSSSAADDDGEGGLSQNATTTTTLLSVAMLSNCSAATVLRAAGFRRRMQPIAASAAASSAASAEEPVWVLRFAGEEDTTATTVAASSSCCSAAAAAAWLSEGDGVDVLEKVLHALERYAAAAAAEAMNGGGGGEAPASPFSSSGGAAIATTNTTKAAVATSSSPPAPAAAEVDLDQIRRLRELRAARQQQQQTTTNTNATTQNNNSAAAVMAAHNNSGTAQCPPSSSSHTNNINIVVDDEALDFSSVKHMIDKVRLTIHKTGRLRNYSFEARDFTLRKMTKGRMAHLCADDRCLQRGEWVVLTGDTSSSTNGTDATTTTNSAPTAAAATTTTTTCTASPSPSPPSPSALEAERGDCLEAHWHVRNANMIYSYVCHLTPSGDKVLHMGEEFGYQYNSLPGTPHFGKTILLSIKKVNMETNMLESMKHPNKPAEKCVVCGVPFPKLWL